MTTHTGRHSPRTFWTTLFGVYWLGRAVAIPELDLNIMTTMSATTRPCGRPSPGYPPPRLWPLVLSKSGRTRVGVSRKAVDNSRSVVSTVTVKVARLYDQATEHDGHRVLVDRVWPRGLTKSRAEIDEWCKQVPPRRRSASGTATTRSGSLSSGAATGPSSAQGSTRRTSHICASWRQAQR